jgi:hypothetical protein
VPCSENSQSRCEGLRFPTSGAKSAPDMGHPGLVEGLGSLNPTSENPDVGHPLFAALHSCPTGGTEVIP